MERLLLAGIIIGLGGWFPARAQVEKGTKYWGGTVSLNGEVQSSREKIGTSTSNNSRHTISPEVQWGKFTNATTMIGLGARYGFTWSKNASGIASTPNSSYSSSGTNQSIALLPFIRKYKRMGERWAVFLHTEVGPTYNWRNSKSTSIYQNSNKRHNWQYELSIKPGLVYFFPKKNLAIEGYADILSLSASYSNFEEDGGRQFTFGTGFSTSFPSYFTVRVAKYLPAKTN